MNNPALALMVLRTSQMETTLAFYRALGFSFVQERHGSGPVHYSTQLGSSVLEIFPSDSPWGRRAVVVDPDGRGIELSEPKKS
jgi:hypothetical protein